MTSSVQTPGVAVSVQVRHLPCIGCHLQLWPWAIWGNSLFSKQKTKQNRRPQPAYNKSKPFKVSFCHLSALNWPGWLEASRNPVLGAPKVRAGTAGCSCAGQCPGLDCEPAESCISMTVREVALLYRGLHLLCSSDASYGLCEIIHQIEAFCF